VSADPASDGSSSPRVSVVVPAADFGHLSRALGSALDQTMPNLEIVLVDDGSIDANARRDVDGLAERDPRLRIFRNERRLGVSAAINRGLDQARGDWIARLDADDVWLPQRLERMLSRASNADVIADDVFRMSADGQSGYSCLRDRWQVPLDLVEPRWLTPYDMVRHHLGYLKPVFRRDFVDRHNLRYNTDLPVQEDFHLYLAMLLRGARWLQLPDGYYLWYRHAGSLSQSAWSDVAIARRVLNAGWALLAEPRVRHDRVLASALEDFLLEERLNAFVLSLKESVRARRLSAAARCIPRWLRGPTDVLPLTRLTLRHLFARVARRRRLIRAVSGRQGVTGLVPLS
jgi:succinoglycan biosynthesis protein ExoO